jgi:hypothetical protein
VVVYASVLVVKGEAPAAIWRPGGRQGRQWAAPCVMQVGGMNRRLSQLLDRLMVRFGIDSCCGIGFNAGRS